MKIMRNKLTTLFIASLCLSNTIIAQEDSKDSIGFIFETIKEVPITSVKNQASSGTCWCFSGLGMIESELIRTGKGIHDLSEMFIVYNNYVDKAKKYVRLHGKGSFAAGGSFADVFEAIAQYGLVPDTIMPGLNYGAEKHKHGEVNSLLTAYINTLITNPNKKLSTAWENGFKGILDAYFGKYPEIFVFEGKNYTPQSYAQSLGINADNYISLTSFTHHPFYKPFIIEVEDNWRWASSYNLPIDELMEVISASLNKGYTVAWGSDVSEQGFSRKGIAIVPDMDAKETAGSDQAHWLGLTEKERQDMVTNLKNPVPELVITQEMRQKAFDNYETTDDHGMLIYGIAKDQNGTQYYLVKNSWGTDNPYKGTWYASESFVKYKTLNVIVHKDVLSKELKKKLGL